MGVDRGVADADLVVEVVSGGASAVAYVADDLAADDVLAGDDVEAGHVSVAGLDAVAVVDDDLVSVTALLIGGDDDSVGGGADGRAVGGGDVYAGVELTFAVAGDWIFTLAEAAGDGTYDGPHGWRVGVQNSGVEAESAVQRRAAEAVDGGAAERCSAQGVEGVEGLVVALVARCCGVGESFGCRQRSCGLRGWMAGELAHGDGELAGGEAVDGGDFAGERAERGDFNVLLVGLLLEVRVVFLERVVILAQLIETGGLDEHPRVGSGEAGDGEHADSGGSHEDVSVMKRDWNLVQVPIFVATYEHDVVAFLKTQQTTWCPNLTAETHCGAERPECTGANELLQSSFALPNSQSLLGFLLILAK